MLRVTDARPPLAERDVSCLAAIPGMVNVMLGAARPQLAPGYARCASLFSRVEPGAPSALRTLSATGQLRVPPELLERALGVGLPTGPDRLALAAKHAVDACASHLVSSSEENPGNAAALAWLLSVARVLWSTGIPDDPTGAAAVFGAVLDAFWATNMSIDHTAMVFGVRHAADVRYGRAVLMVWYMLNAVSAACGSRWHAVVLMSCAVNLGFVRACAGRPLHCWPKLTPPRLQNGLETDPDVSGLASRDTADGGRPPATVIAAARRAPDFEGSPRISFMAPVFAAVNAQTYPTWMESMHRAAHTHGG